MSIRRSRGGRPGRPGSLGLFAATAALAVLGVSCDSGPGPRFSGELSLAHSPNFEAPVPVTTVQPQYPDFARDAQIEGTVVLNVWVGTSGRVENVVLIHGVTGLNDTAINAARQWVFKPAMRYNEPVASWYGISFVFKL